MRILSLLVAAVALVGASKAEARLLEPKHEGFFLRFQAGPGYMQADLDRDATLRGGAGTLGVAIGGTVAPNLILYGEIVAQSSPDPHLEMGRFSGIAEDLTITYTGFGPGLAYYLPGNFYLSGSLHVARAEIEMPGVRGRTELGIGTRLSLGKEWWVSSDWGLGLALVGDLASMKDAGPEDVTIGVGGLSLAFSATFN